MPLPVRRRKISLCRVTWCTQYRHLCTVCPVETGHQKTPRIYQDVKQTAQTNNENQKADAYCFGWICKATEKVKEKELTPEEKTLIDKYVDTHLHVTGNKHPTNRLDLNKDINSIIAGQTDGAKVNYFRGVGTGQDNPLKIGG